MKSSDIRRSFLDFFVERGHRAFPSAPLVPHGDPTLLFTNAGMVPFKDYFLGRAVPPSKRAVSSQKCLRVSGKHNDLENVGPSPRHHTFFEMLGNFSFGDYFKEEAIRFAWELVTQVWGIRPGHLAATVFEEDDEAAELWVKVAGLPAGRVHRCGMADNFWAMGETGPCGPCSEIYVDRRPQFPEVGWEEGTASGRYLEVWNLVFMQFERDESGQTHPLPNPSIDTGAGLERLAAVLQGVESNYDSDLFQPILRAAAILAGTEYGRQETSDVSLRVIADHLRAVCFLLADGVIPGNEGRGYVLRRILRRAVRHGMRLGFEEPFLHRLVGVLGEVLGAAYPELTATAAATAASVKVEEEKFLSTLAAASRQVQEAVDRARAEGRSELPGEAVFRLYDTFGLPVELIREIAEEERLGIDMSGFESALEAQRSRSRAATGETQKRLAAVVRVLAGEGGGRFEGHECLRLEGATVLRLARREGDRVVVAERLSAGERGVVVLDRTPFYAEAGGQVGDRGWLGWEGGSAEVSDAQKDGAGTHYHFVEVVEGTLATGSQVAAAVDEELRASTERNHTATHLLHAALRRVLGEGARQAGSLVSPQRLRFDFTHGEPLRPEQLTEVEDLVNRWVLAARHIIVTPGRSYQEAVTAGAMALFGEKYGEVVRTVEVPALPIDGGGLLDSLELCGGCHVRNTGEIGAFLVVAERGIASGVRRIEALTGTGALAWVRAQRDLVAEICAHLGVGPERALQEVEAVKRRLREAEGDLSRLRVAMVSGTAGEGREVEVEGVKVMAREVPAAPAAEMRQMVDALRSKLGSGVVVLAARDGDRVTLVTAVSADLRDRLHAGELVRDLAPFVGGGGGGREDFAQAGGREPEGLPAALASVPDLVRGQLARAASGTRLR